MTGCWRAAPTETGRMLNKNELLALEEKLKTKTVGIVGDFCVDVYWHADMKRSALSRETPHFPLPVTDERVSLGAGGNVAANLAALRPGAVKALTLAGDDWRGVLLRERAAACGIFADGVITVPGRMTNAYCKPMRHGISDVVYEDPRLDFEAQAPITEETEALALEALQKLALSVDVLCVADQFAFGIVTPAVRNALCAYAADGLPVVADSRSRIGTFRRCILKPNEVECWRALYGDEAPQPDSAHEIRAAADALAKRNDALVFCTLGVHGAYLTRGEGGTAVPALRVEGPVDICGAGDTSLAAFSAALACGESPETAAAFAAMASAVTVQKLGETGTVSFAEISALA